MSDKDSRIPRIHSRGAVNKTILTYPQPTPWAALDEEGELLFFDYDACVKASGSEELESKTYATLLIKILQFLQEKLDDEEKLFCLTSALKEFKDINLEKLCSTT